MSASWDRKHWAVVVPESVRQCHDVLSASSDIVDHTPGPFGIRVQPCDELGHSRGSPFQLIYVPEAAAQDRSQEHNPLNGAGVHAGWYVIATPGRFTVQVLQVKSDHYRLPWEDALEVELEVDGHSIHWRKSFIQKNNKLGVASTENYVFDGFVEKGLSLESAKYDRLHIVRPFSFEKIFPEESHDLQSSNVGAITLKAKAGKVEIAKTLSKAKFSTQLPNEKVSEKAVAKLGTTMKVSHGLSPIVKMRRRALIYFQVSNYRILPEMEITLHVRERSWLRSRHLIDDNDQPVTYASFRKDLLADQSLHHHTQTRRNSAGRNTEVRTIIEEEAVLVDDVEPSTSF